ncbi:MAG: MFS transporter [Lysobacterales bacterium 14-68-21]|jgi:MFS family permease|nr:MAG: MFS transporter [Xanthomonadales bacterium 15-68-25]OZB66403.1 MAG: MFS transporter [Xanthomonadales bacterium 14-68-21]
MARHPLATNPDFRLLFGGSTVSMFGDQFTLVALPWLVLKLTGDPGALGLVLATMAVPRAVFMLIGGAVVDHFSARAVLLLARGANAVMVAALAAMVLTGAISMPWVYALALGIGLATAFAYPASTALLPSVIEPQQLQQANGAMMGMRQLSLFIGPALAGVVIGTGTHAPTTGSALADAHGLGWAFAIDAASFCASLLSLALIRVPAAAKRGPARHGVLGQVLGGLRGIAADPPLRAFMLYAAVVSVFVGGPTQVGLPVLADMRLDDGATSLGIVMAASGGGMLLGGLLSGAVAKLVRGHLGAMILCFDACIGLALVGLAGVHSTVLAAVLLGLTGLLGGIVQITLVSWIQRRVPREMLGRTMSVLMFTFLGLGPLSAAGVGALLKVISLPALFVAAGLTLTAIALGCLSSPALRGIRAQDAAPQAA